MADLNNNYVQALEYHCFYCHGNFPADTIHHCGTSTGTTPCTSLCGKWFYNGQKQYKYCPHCGRELEKNE